MDLTKLSDEDLLALHKGDLRSVSDAGLAMLAGGQSEQTPKEQPLTWKEAAASGIERFPESALNVAEQTVQPLLHPIDTAQNVVDLGNAALQKVLPDAIVQIMPESTRNNPEKLNAVIDFYKNRYGSAEGLKKAIATDPAAVLTDLSTVLTGGGALASKIPSLAKAGQIVSKAGEWTAPLSAASKAAGATINAGIPSSLIGLTTGVGKDVIGELYGAGKQGGERLAVALRNMRSPGGEFKDIVTESREALDALRRQRAEKYRTQMADIAEVKKPAVYAEIENAISEKIKQHQFHGIPTGEEAGNIQGKILNEIQSWGEYDPAIFHTAEGLDWLKRRIGDIGESTQPYTSPRKVADEAYNVIKGQIAEKYPAYNEAMKDYAQASELLHELQGTFSLGEKARTDTAVRKLQQALKNNQNTNFGYRGELIKELENAGAKNLRPRIAGQSAATWTPRGLQGASAGALATMATQNPVFAFGLPFQSPRLMGEAAVLAGKTAGLVPDFKGIDPKLLSMYLYQMNQPKEAQ